MGAYHGAQACEVVGLFLLSELVKLKNFTPILYRDDGLGITNSKARQTGKLRESIINNNLKITIETGLTTVDFLDVTLDLERGIYKPYRKPGDKPLYVSARSNHPPGVLKNIPLGIKRRLCDIQLILIVLLNPKMDRGSTGSSMESSIRSTFDVA